MSPYVILALFGVIVIYTIICILVPVYIYQIRNLLVDQKKQNNELMKYMKHLMSR